MWAPQILICVSESRSRGTYNSKNLICNRFVWVASIDVTKSSEFKKCAKTNFPILHTFILKNSFFDLRRPAAKSSGYRSRPLQSADIDPGLLKRN